MVRRPRLIINPRGVPTRPPFGYDRTCWRHVIGTRCPVWDESVAALTAQLYQRLHRNGTLQPAAATHALHHPGRVLHDVNRHRPSVWALFTHIGP